MDRLTLSGLYINKKRNRMKKLMNLLLALALVLPFAGCHKDDKAKKPVKKAKK
jgi:hypothetical protein